MRGRPKTLASGVGALTLLTFSAAPMVAQRDSVTVVPSQRYVAGPVHEKLLGSKHRDLWSTPIRVPVIDLATFGGGLEPVQRGGGQQTRSLRLRGPDGQEYNFRSLDKWVTPDPREDLEGTPVEWLIQDQVSSLHPSAIPVATGLLDAVGILNPAPQLMVMPDDERLGEFRELFAGMIGTLELHVEEPEEVSARFGDAIVDNSEDVIELIHAGPADRIDTNAYLRDRLMSLLIGDWDRHEGQFRWVGFSTEGVRWWVPIPEDRDYAFSDYDGLAISMLRPMIPKMVTFRNRYPGSLAGLTINSSEIDRRILAGVPRSAWIEAVSSIQRGLTNEEIVNAVRRMPAEHFALHGEELIRTLSVRRDSLPEVANRFYLRLSSEPEIHGTDEPERLEIIRLSDGSVHVTVTPLGQEEGVARPLLDRVFLRTETKELRIYLRDGADVATITGEATRSIPLRIIGGAGADTLIDRSRSGAWAVFHDADGEGVLDGGIYTYVDRQPFEEPVWVPGEILPPFDWGRSVSLMKPWVGYDGEEGVIVGAGPSWTWYGFRRFPFSARASLRAMYGFGSRDAGVEGDVEWMHVGSGSSSSIRGRISGLQSLRFHGMGNDSPEEIADAAEVLRYDQWMIEALLNFLPKAGLRLSIGPKVEWLDPEVDAISHPQVSESDRAGYGKAGLGSTIRLETQPGRGFFDGGFTLDLDGDFFPAAWDLTSPFGRLRAEFSGYAPLPGSAILAVRAGGAQLLGNAPLLESIGLGGSGDLRGYDSDRYTGDAAVFAGMDLRQKLARVRLLLNTDFGVLAFADAGRVFLEGNSAGAWHTGLGAGVWVGSAGRALSLSVAEGEKRAVYLKLGFPF